MHVRGTLPLQGYYCTDDHRRQWPHLAWAVNHPIFRFAHTIPQRSRSLRSRPSNRTAARVPSASTRMEAKRTLGNTSICSGRTPSAKPFVLPSSVTISMS